jgi:hypothetical protein
VGERANGPAIAYNTCVLFNKYVKGRFMSRTPPVLAAALVRLARRPRLRSSGHRPSKRSDDAARSDVALRSTGSALLASLLISVSAHAATGAADAPPASPNAAVAAPDAAVKKGLNMTHREAWNLYQRYLGAWNSNSIEQRVKIAAELLAENIEYQTVRHDLGSGRSRVVEDMATFHEKFPGGHFEIGDVSSHHDVALVTWVIIQADGKEFARGHDQLTVGGDGKISKLITFGPSAKDPD